MKKRKIVLMAAIAAISVCLLYLSEPSKWFATFGYDRMSPNCYYRLESWISFYSSDYGFVKLYDARSGRLLQESEVVFITSNGEEYWPVEGGLPRLKVGRDISIPLSVEPEIAIGHCASK